MEVFRKVDGVDGYVHLPLISELQHLQAHDSFVLVEDPLVQKKTLIIGMFVLRPALEAWTSDIVCNEKGLEAMFSVKEWAFNFRGLDGGWLLANQNTLDAFRLALQYALCDAVIVGSKTVTEEGCDRIVGESVKQGYLWQPYGPCEWKQLASVDSQLASKLAQQRKSWQSLGYLSDRTFPAQIFVSVSGSKHDGHHDILSARAFSAVHPNGDEIEVYIVSSTSGCEKIRQRIGNYPHLIPRIDKILIDLSPPNQPNVIDLQSLPTVLFHQYKITIANHDGGKSVLEAFAQAQILPQINLTLCRNRSLKEVILVEHSLPQAVVENVSSGSYFREHVELFFSHNNGKLCENFEPISILTDTNKDVAVVTFDTRQARQF